MVTTYEEYILILTRIKVTIFWITLYFKKRQRLNKNAGGIKGKTKDVYRGIVNTRFIYINISINYSLDLTFISLLYDNQNGGRINFRFL